jgi:hypothetical protein
MTTAAFSGGTSATYSVKRLWLQVTNAVERT